MSKSPQVYRYLRFLQNCPLSSFDIPGDCKQAEQRWKECVEIQGVRWMGDCDSIDTRAHIPQSEVQEKHESEGQTATH